VLTSGGAAGILAAMTGRDTKVRPGNGRVGGWVAIVLSALWALPGVALVAVGALVVLSGRGDSRTVDMEGFAEFIGGSLAVAGGVVVAGAAAGILLGVRLLRGRSGARVGLVLLFGLFALVSGSFLTSALADSSGVDLGAAVGSGLNTAACLAVVVLALLARRNRSVGYSKR
jgi:hypothetical protein